MWDGVESVAIMMIPISFLIGSFVLLGIAIWSRQKRRERESFYRQEIAKSLIDKGADQEELMKLLKQETKRGATVRREGMKIAGLVLFAAGIGYMLAFYRMSEDVWPIGAIPSMIGLAIFVYGAFMSPKVASDD